MTTIKINDQEMNRIFSELKSFRESFLLANFVIQPQVMHFSMIKKGQKVRVHSHRTYECSMVVNGNIKYIVDRKATVPPRNLLIVPPGIKHTWEAFEDSLVVSIMLFISCPGNGAKTWITKLNKSIERHNYQISLGCEFEHIMKKILTEAQNGWIGWEENILYITRQLFITIFRKLLPVTQTKFHHRNLPPQRGNKTQSTIDLVCYYIQDNLSRSPKVREISNYIGISQVHLNRIFTNELGITVSQYLTNFRISISRKLLRSTDRPLQDIASSVGYEDVQYFCRVFKKQTGMTPSEFRRNIDTEK